MMIIDGTFTKGKDFKHIVLLGVTFDSANRIVLLCAGIVPQEDAEQWVWFHGNASVDFPGFNVLMADADKGITSNEFQLSQEEVEADTSRCARHIAPNCKESCRGGPKMNDAHKQSIISLFKQRTESSHHEVLEENQNVFSPWADWLDERMDQFATHSFLQRGKNRWGKVISE